MAKSIFVILLVCCSVKGQYPDLNHNKIAMLNPHKSNLKLFIKELAKIENEHGPDSLRLVPILHSIARNYENLGKFRKAEKYYQRALTIIEKLPGNENLETYLEYLLNNYKLQARYEEAEKTARRLMTMAEEHPEQAGLFPRMETVALLNLAQGRFSEAALIYQQLLSLWEELKDDDSQFDLGKVIELQLKLTRCYLVQGKEEEAKALYNRALHHYKSNRRNKKELVLHPEIIVKPRPCYTAVAYHNKVKGIVVLSATFTATSEVQNIKVLSDLGHGLDEQAIRAARRIKFLPGIKQGRTVDIRTRLEYDFSLL